MLAALLAFGASAFAQQYKWVDKDGRVRYGDVPPPGVQARPLRPPPAVSAPPAAPDAKAPLSTAEKDAEFRKRQEEALKEREKQEIASRDAAAKKENCARAQEYLRTLQSGQRITRTDAKGERVFLEDSQVAQETAQARQAVQQWCN